MSDIGQAMLVELKRIREALEGGQTLGFGKRSTPIYVFIKHQIDNGQVFVWYTRDKTERRNALIPERDLTGYIRNVWRFDRTDDTTGQKVPRLNIAVHAGKDYIIQTGFYTNFSKTFLAALLEQTALEDPITLVVETNEGSRHRPTLFCRLEWRDKRMTPTLGEPKELYEQAVARFGFTDPYNENPRSDGGHHAG